MGRRLGVQLSLNGLKERPKKSTSCFPVLLIFGRRKSSERFQTRRQQEKLKRSSCENRLVSEQTSEETRGTFLFIYFFSSPAVGASKGRPVRGTLALHHPRFHSCCPLKLASSRRGEKLVFLRFSAALLALASLNHLCLIRGC